MPGEKQRLLAHQCRLRLAQALAEAQRRGARRGSLQADESVTRTGPRLGAESWASSCYGLVSLKGHAPSAAAVRFRECLREAEAALVREESLLLTRHAARARAATVRPKRKS